MVDFRKLISFGKSSYVISLPKTWINKNNLSKGSLLAIHEDEGILRLSPDFKGKQPIETKNIDISKLNQMVVRTIHALYKQGVDEINVTYTDPEMITMVQKSLGKEAMGFEIIEQGRNRCSIKNISTGLEGFEVLLRKTFLVLISMADESLEIIKTKEFKRLQHVVFLEEANNRFTTSCRRIINKGGIKNPKKVGPMYYIVEDIENLADQYKYLCNYLSNIDAKKVKISNEVMEVYGETNDLLKTLYEVFYKLDHQKLSEMADSRKNIVKKLYTLLESTSNKTETVIIHYLLVIVQKIFGLIGPTLTMEL